MSVSVNAVDFTARCDILVLFRRLPLEGRWLCRFLVAFVALFLIRFNPSCSVSRLALGCELLKEVKVYQPNTGAFTSI